MEISNPPKQTKQTARLGARIRRLRERRRPLTWTAICQRLNILNPSGEAATGIAYKIAYREYEPSHREVRARLGLRDVCMTCLRPYRRKGPPRVRTEIQDWWLRLSATERAAILENAYSIYRKEHDHG